VLPPLAAEPTAPPATAPPAVPIVSDLVAHPVMPTVVANTTIAKMDLTMLPPSVRDNQFAASDVPLARSLQPVYVGIALIPLCI
jgi:hypothetical protein